VKRIIQTSEWGPDEQIPPKRRTGTLAESHMTRCRAALTVLGFAPKLDVSGFFGRSVIALLIRGRVVERIFSENNHRTSRSVQNQPGPPNVLEDTRAGYRDNWANREDAGPASF